MVDKTGKLALDDSFLKLFDELMQKLTDTRAIAERIREY